MLTLSVYIHTSLADYDVNMSSQPSANMAQIHALEEKAANAEMRLRERKAPPPPDYTQPPVFVTKPRDQLNLMEGRKAHFEAKLEPVTDPNLQVEWLKDGEPVIIGHRFRPVHDFGYCALDIIGVIPEDSGHYTCRATNLVGTAETHFEVACKSKDRLTLQPKLTLNIHGFDLTNDL